VPEPIRLTLRSVSSEVSANVTRSRAAAFTSH
jgi:hypothetical protein